MRSPIRAHHQLPDLERFRGNALVAGLDNRDFFQSIGCGPVGDVLRAVGKDHVAIDGVLVPLLSAGKLRELVGSQRSLHGCVLPWLRPTTLVPRRPQTVHKRRSH